MKGQGWSWTCEQMLKWLGSEVFVSFSLGCSDFAAAAVAASVTASHCTTNRDSAALADASVVAAGVATVATFAAVPVVAAATQAAVVAVAAGRASAVTAAVAAGCPWCCRSWRCSQCLCCSQCP